jgi:hypothetical protein
MLLNPYRFAGGGGGGGGASAFDEFDNQTAGELGLAAYNADWTVMQGGFTVNLSDVCYGTATTTCLARFNGETWASSHRSQGVLSGVASSLYIGLAVGLQTGATSGYYIITDNAGYNELGRTNAGADTVLDSTTITQTWAAGDVMRMDISYPNGSTTRIVIARAAAASPTSFSTLLTYDDTSGSRLTGGQPGLAAYGSSGGTAGFTRWDGADL